MDLADLSVGGLVRLSRVGKGQTTWAARRKYLREALTGRTSMNSIQYCEISMLCHFLLKMANEEVIDGLSMV